MLSAECACLCPPLPPCPLLLVAFCFVACLSPPAPSGGEILVLFFALVLPKSGLFVSRGQRWCHFGTPLNVLSHDKCDSISITRVEFQWPGPSRAGLGRLLCALGFVELCFSAKVVTLGAPSRARLLQLSGLYYSEYSSTSATATPMGCYGRCSVCGVPYKLTYKLTAGLIPRPFWTSGWWPWRASGSLHQLYCKNDGAQFSSTSILSPKTWVQF